MDSATIIHIIKFIRSIGINVDHATIETKTTIPGVTIKDAGLVVDSTKLKSPSDILLKAGYIAVTPKNLRVNLNDNTTVTATNKLAATAWAYVASKNIGIDKAAIAIDSDQSTAGMQLLKQYGMAQSNNDSDDLEMVNWLSQQEVIPGETTEKDKMLSGEPYRANDTELVKLRTDVRKKLGIYNQVGVHHTDVQYALLTNILGTCGTNSWIEPPFHCDYGFNITMGKDSYMNFDCVILDVAPVVIGDNVMMGPKVQLLAATHVLDPTERNFSGTELGKPITIGNRAWLGAGVIVCPGVTIGDEAVIGAGSVVTRDIPPRVFAAGNPCKIIKEIA